MAMRFLDWEQPYSLGIIKQLVSFCSLSSLSKIYRYERKSEEVEEEVLICSRDDGAACRVDPGITT